MKNRALFLLDRESFSRTSFYFSIKAKFIFFTSFYAILICAVAKIFTIITFYLTCVLFARSFDSQSIFFLSLFFQNLLRFVYEKIHDVIQKNRPSFKQQIVESRLLFQCFLDGCTSFFLENSFLTELFLLKITFNLLAKSTNFPSLYFLPLIKTVSVHFSMKNP